MRQRLLNLPRHAKRALVAGADALLCALATWTSPALISGSVPDLTNRERWLATLAALCVSVPVFVMAGSYNAIFRYVGLNSLLSLAKAFVVYSAGHVLVVGVIGLPGIPRTVAVLQPMVLLLFMISLRLGVRFWFEGQLASSPLGSKRARVLIFGAGSAGRQLAAAMFRSEAHRVVGYLDDDPRLWGHTLDGVRVFSPERLKECFDAVNPQEVLLALPSATQHRRSAILESLREYPVHVRTLPSVVDLASGKVDLSDLRELELEDLLGRDAVPPNTLLLNRNTRGKVVLVSGAGGSIGSELCRQIAACSPTKLLLVDNSEFALYAIDQELADAGVPVVPLLASVTDEARMRQILSTWRPQTVYHAAAFKHVPLVEHNPVQGVSNNVWGTWICARAALQAGVANFVLVSTDKAVRPTNIMGASKRLAELILQAMAKAPASGDTPKSSRTCFAMVRFGNVLGSSGSVVPLFREQIRNGGPITLTHPEITRYFMTIPEAAQLVIQVGAMANSGEVYVLDMGKPVRIMDLAQRLVELSGLTVRSQANPKGDIEIKTTGLRPGEKLYEELLIGNDPQPTPHPRIMKAREEAMPWGILEPTLAQMAQILQAHDIPALKQLLQTVVVGYEPAADVVDWVWGEKAARGIDRLVDQPVDRPDDPPVATDPVPALVGRAKIAH
jgi:FlaA1/EpsC-like NDP-sugar epimerase